MHRHHQDQHRSGEGNHPHRTHRRTTGQVERLLKKAGFTNVITRPDDVDTHVIGDRGRRRP